MKRDLDLCQRKLSEANNLNNKFKTRLWKERKDLDNYKK